MDKKVFCVVFLALVVLMSTGSSYAGGPIGIPKTGETTNYGTGSDGELQRGVAWPSPRFTDNVDGTVTDNLTSLIWLKNANCFGGQLWAGALSSANGLATGSCGLSDGTVAHDWRLPNGNELQSLVDVSTYAPALPTGHPFTNVQLSYYWSSTSSADSIYSKEWINMNDGVKGHTNYNTSFYVWPVRGGW